MRRSMYIAVISNLCLTPISQASASSITQEGIPNWLIPVPAMVSFTSSITTNNPEGSRIMASLHNNLKNSLQEMEFQYNPSDANTLSLLIAQLNTANDNQLEENLLKSIADAFEEKTYQQPKIASKTCLTATEVDGLLAYIETLRTRNGVDRDVRINMEMKVVSALFSGNALEGSLADRVFSYCSKTLHLTFGHRLLQCKIAWYLWISTARTRFEDRAQKLLADTGWLPYCRIAGAVYRWFS